MVIGLPVVLVYLPVFVVVPYVTVPLPETMYAMSPKLLAQIQKTKKCLTNKEYIIGH